nr:DNA repair protein [Tranzscheliella williamsii]
MAAGKRHSDERSESRGAFEDPDDVLDAVSPKRRRIGTDQIQSQRTEAGHARSAGEEVGDGEDEDHEEEEEENEEDQLSSDVDRLQDDAPSSGSNSDTAQSGIIEEIELVNFMCHANFHVEFGPQLNFVMGHNGSGKSTILTALMIALGGSTKSTFRGKSLKDLIQHGKPFATITVTIKNEGSDAYKPELFGRRIIVERKILADKGGGQTKMKDATGKTISTTKAELDAFCDYANIQADNPIHILTQDLARQFLGSSDAGDIYKFFLEGTQLSQLVREYNLIDAHVRSMKTALALKSSSIQELELRAQHALQQWQKVRETRGYQEKIDTLNQETVWVHVHNARRELEAAVEKTEQIREKLEGYQARLQASLEQLDKCNKEISDLDGESNSFDDELSPLNEQRENLLQKNKALATELKSVTSREREFNEQIRQLNAQLERYEDQIREEAAKLAGDRQAHRQQLELTREELVQRKASLQEEEVEREEEMQSIEQDLTELLQKEDEEDVRLSRLREQYESNDTRLQRMRESTRNRITAFGGPNVPRLLKAIQDERGWNSPPLGPLGVHLKLKDMRWQRVLESVIGNALNAFFVSNHRDRQKLQSLMQRTNCRAMIFSGTTRLFDYTAGEPDANLLTILRVLECDNEIVKRQLITAVHIERAVLVEKRSDADRLMRNEHRNVQHCYTADMYSVSGGRVGSQSTALAEHQGAPRLSQNVTDDIRHLEEEQKRIDQEISTSTHVAKQYRQQRSDLERRKQKLKQAQSSGRRQVDIVRTDIDRLDDEMKDAAPGNISGLEEAKQETEDQKEQIVEQFKAIQEEKSKIADERRPIQASIEEIDEKIRSFDDRMAELQARMQKAVADRIQQQTNKDHYQKKANALAAEIVQCEEEESRLEAEHQNLEEQAKRHCDEVESTRTLEDIEAERRELQMLKNKAASAAGISLEQASEHLQNRQRILTEAQEEVGSMNEAEQRLRHALAMRYAKWNYFRRSIATRAKSNFARNLAKRGYTGRLVFNHKSEKLSLHVQTEDKRQRSTQTQSHSNKGMSGGERSFATACLLLALWQAMSSPIRCLDEFDIFMDQVNRRVALGMIIEETRATPHVQYILITPQDMPDLKGQIE